MPEFLFLNFVEFSTHCFSLARQIRERSSAKKIDYLVSVQRGGAVMSKVLSDILQVPIATMVVSSYQDLKQVKQPFISQEISVDITDKNIVVLDEICDSGDTLRLVVDYLKQKEPKEITTGVLVLKPKATFLPDLHAMQTEKWVVFPGELRETAEALNQFETVDPQVLQQFRSYAEQHGATPETFDQFGVQFKH